ncbi:uncharacterized protein LOC129917101 [Episyrphus balteatus]|uniref:uncharacterized protein LOC129917101 n=1 Tax=Episyrphus balteatus TaxID=286459 RepID=UPI0024867265|nr:uncharacterized protein LOC129917101 [Episyrphus balteatus]
MEDCNPVSTPLDINQKLIKETCQPSKEETDYMKTVPYQEAIGSILYAAQVSRPDLSFAVGALLRFNSNPSKSHWGAVKRLFRYIKGTLDYKLEYSRDNEGCLEGFSDADWASDSDDRKSTTGYLFKYQGGPISWNAKKQPTVALSTTEAEYMALASTSQEALWLQSLLRELINWNQELILQCDNKSAINLSKNNIYHARSKHIDIRHHFVRDLVEEKKLKVTYLKTEAMPADVMTKGLPATKHNNCCRFIGFLKV